MEKNGVIPKDVVYPAFVKELGITGVSSDTLLEDYRENYADFVRRRAPGAVETVRALREAGVKTCILTNGNVRVQNAKIDALGIRGLLDTIVISEDVGLRKPDPAIFALTLTELGVDAPSTLFVGDNPEVDVVGAANAGLANRLVPQRRRLAGGARPKGGRRHRYDRRGAALSGEIGERLHSSRPGFARTARNHRFCPRPDPKYPCTLAK